jgi:hypothetical protein
VIPRVDTTQFDRLTQRGWIALTLVRSRVGDRVAGTGLAGPHVMEAREDQAGPAVRFRSKAIF